MEREKKIVDDIHSFVFDKLENEASGHDFWHIYRVHKMSRVIAEYEGANIFICEVAALVHDLIDDKLDNNIRLTVAELENYLEKIGLTHSEIDSVVNIITKMSFSAKVEKEKLSLEGKVVQDADRLDALGAIGIARTMIYSGNKGRVIHNPNIKARENITFEQYRNEESTAIMHFYEKLLKLKDLMNTEYGKKLAKERHKFMENYLEQFYKEWEGKL